jgi:hypothetical protein
MANRPGVPYCGIFDVYAYALAANPWGWAGIIAPHVGGSSQCGWATVYERSHIPLHQWMLGLRLMASSKKGVSAHQLHRTLNINYKSAWFLAHRIREAMKDDGSALGGGGKISEADSTFYGPKDRTETPAARPTGRKGKPGGGRARSVKSETLTTEAVRKILLDNASIKS